MATTENNLKGSRTAKQIEFLNNKQRTARNAQEIGVVHKDEYLKGFIWEGITQNGRVRMPIEAPSEKILRIWLDEAHIEVLKIEKQIGRVSGAKRIKNADIALFAGQYARRKESGQGDIDAIKSCAEATNNYTMRIALGEVIERMENGMSPEAAFAESRIYNVRKKRHTERKTFSKEFVSTIKAGKRGGAVTLLKDYEHRLARTIEQQAEVVSELIYPAIVVVLAIILVQVLVFVVIPQFKPFYEGILGDKSMRLPLLTQIVVGISDFSTSWYGIPIILSLIGSFLYVIYLLIFNEKGIDWRQERELFLPKYGPLNFQAISKLIAANQGSKHLTSLGQITKATDIGTALRETAGGSPHVVYKRVLYAMSDTIAERGGKLSVTGRPYTHLFGDDFFALMETGATEGDLSVQILKLADQLQAEYETGIKRLMKLITPVTVVFLGLTIGTVIIAMYLPMLDIIGRLANK